MKIMIELKRIKNNHIGIYSILACILSGVLGFFLLISLDGYKFEEISLGLLQYSVYTVYTQFGFFIFPVLAIYSITIDYKEKNIAFYKNLGFNEQSYFLCKACTLLIFITVGNIFTSMIISIIYGDFSNVLLFLLKLENVSVFITILSLLYAYLFKNMMVSYCVNFALWVTSIVVYSIHDFFKIFCFYDASLEKHSDFQEVLESRVFMHTSVISEVLYNIITLIIILFIIYAFRKRWSENGI